jgi:hypothetical protein
MTEKRREAGSARDPARPAAPYEILFGLVFGIVLGLTVYAIARARPGSRAWSRTSRTRWPDLPAAHLHDRGAPRLLLARPGVLELGDVKNLGRVGGKTLLYTLFASGISVAIGSGS